MTNPRVGSGEASTSTVRRRSWELRSHRKRVSGGDDITQLSKEIESSGRDTRKALIDQLFTDGQAFRVSISAKESLAIKTDLQIPWAKFRVLRRQAKNSNS